MYLHNLLSKILIKSNELMPQKTLIFKINISENVTGTTKNIFLQRCFHEESNDWIKNMCHRARFFVLVTFLKNREKNKDYKSVVSPFHQFFCLSTPYCISLGGDIAIID